jgi:hypothetical protein
MRHYLFESLVLQKTLWTCFSLTRGSFFFFFFTMDIETDGPVDFGDLRPAEAAPAVREGTGTGEGQRAPTEGLSSDGGRLRKPGHKQQRLHAAGSGNEELRRRREPEKVGSVAVDG